MLSKDNKYRYKQKVERDKGLKVIPNAGGAERCRLQSEMKGCAGIGVQPCANPSNVHPTYRERPEPSP